MKKRFIASVLSAIIFLTLAACAAQSSRPEETAAVRPQSEPGPVTVSHPLESKEQQTMNAAAAVAVRRYVEARIKTDAFVAADFHAMSADARAQMINELAQLWEAALDQATALQNSASAMKDPASKGMAAAFLSASAGKRCSVRALSVDSGAAGAPANTFDPKAWAENFTKQYDSIKGANTIKQLAAQLGTDAKEAYAQLTLAQDIIRSGAAEDAAYYDQLTKIAQATKTACKVGLFVTATIATGGGTLGTLAASSMTLGQAGAVIVGGTDCIVDVATTGSTIILGEGSQVTVAAEGLKDKLAPLSAVVGLVTFNPASTGEQIAYIGDTLADWFFEGKILGVKVAGDSDGMSVMVNAITTAGKTPQQIAQELQKSGFIAPQATPAPASESPTPTPATPAPSIEPAVPSAAPPESPVTPSFEAPAPTAEAAAPSATPSESPPSGDTALTAEEISGTYTVKATNISYTAQFSVSGNTATFSNPEGSLTFSVLGNTLTAGASKVFKSFVITFNRENDGSIVGKGTMIIGKNTVNYTFTKVR